MSASGTTASAATTEKPCRTCVDFKTWSKQQNKNFSVTKSPNVNKEPSVTADSHVRREDCPLDKDQLGKASWGLLHTIAAYYPTKPTIEQATEVKDFFKSFARIYPCEYCAKDLREDLQVNPPQTSSQTALSQWLCKLHNRVNVKLGKPEFDCTRVNERWRDGWLDGSCD